MAAVSTPTSEYRRESKPFRADHVGSLLRPPRLIEARRRRERDEITASDLRQVEDQCIEEVVRQQEGIGLKSVTDGEFRRAWWHLDVFEQIEGVAIREGTIGPSFQREDGPVKLRTQSIVIESKLNRPHPIQLGSFTFLKSVSHGTPKVTMPSPSWLFIRSGRDHVSASAYPDLDEFAGDLARIYVEELTDLAAAGCTYLQFDETNYATLCDERIRADFRKVGRDPDDLLKGGTKLLNEVIARAPDEMTICVHACRGNFRSAWVAEGGYEATADLLFNQLNADGYFLEFDDARSGGFSPLRLVPKGKRVVLGLVTSKRGRLESKDELRRRIDEAAKYVPIEQICLSPQCGFSSTEHGNEITHADQMAKLRRIVEVADEIWGTH